MKLSRRRLVSLGGLVLLSSAGCLPALARRGRGRGGDDHHRDYDQARSAVTSGDALPLSEILIEVKKVIDGDVLDVELQRTDQGIIYSIRLLSRNGTYHRVTVDAKTKIILKIEMQ
jgi:uncharacterized membrane protein YkoI